MTKKGSGRKGAWSPGEHRLRFEFEVWLCNVLAVRPWANSLTSLSPSFLLSKRELTPTLQSYVEDI